MILKIFKGLLSIIVAFLGTILIGFVMLFIGVGLLSVPTWATFVILFFGGRYAYALVDLIGGLKCFSILYLINNNYKVCAWLSAIVILLVAINICFKFWAFDAPYGWMEYLIMGILMVVFILRSIKSITCVIGIYKDGGI